MPQITFSRKKQSKVVTVEFLFDTLYFIADTLGKDNLRYYEDFSLKTLSLKGPFERFLSYSLI